MRRKKRNKKVKKYNKFFSYNCTERKNKNFSYKDFSYSNSYNTRFTNSIFYGNSFYKATMKYCGFNGCKFSFIEFKSVNFRGCRFKGAHFENVIFENCNLSNTHFQNVYLVNTSLKSAKGIQDKDILTNITNSSLKLSLTPQLLEVIEESKTNPYIIASGTIFQKKKGHLSNAQKRAEKLLPKQERKRLQRERQTKLLVQAKQMSFNKVSIIRLLDNFTESEVAQGLHLATLSIDKDFSSLSYFIPYIKKANSIN